MLRIIKNFRDSVLNPINAQLTITNSDPTTEQQLKQNATIANSLTKFKKEQTPSVFQQVTLLPQQEINVPLIPQYELLMFLGVIKGK